MPPCEQLTQIKTIGLIIVILDHSEELRAYDVLGRNDHVFGETLNILPMIKFPADIKVASDQIDAPFSLMDLDPDVA